MMNQKYKKLGLRNLRYAVDTALFATTPRGTKNPIKFVKEHSDQKGLHVNVKNTKIITADKRRDEAAVKIDEEIEKSENF